jgi:hypothetical protein
MPDIGAAATPQIIQSAAQPELLAPYHNCLTLGVYSRPAERVWWNGTDHSLATGRYDVVLCHLNHRLVQMCLRLVKVNVWMFQTGLGIRAAAATSRFGVRWYHMAQLIFHAGTESPIHG